MKESCYDDDSSTADQITIEVNSFDDSNESHFINSWDVRTSAPPTASALASNASAVGKRTVIFKKNSREFREIVKIKPSRHSPIKPERTYKKRRLVDISPPLTTMQRVVTDVPEKENKLKRPGPFQAANKVFSTFSSTSGPSRTGGQSSGWITQVKGATASSNSSSGSMHTTNGNVSAASESDGPSSSGVPCNYCSVILTTKLEADLHTVAQHRHERACLRQPLTCLEEGCIHSSQNLHGLKQHLSTLHQINITSKFFTFQRMDEFNCWKKELEASCGSKFQFFSVFSEVTGGCTRLFVCNNEGRYDHHYAKLVRPRKHNMKLQRSRIKGADDRKCGRACPAQLLVRSWGWGAIEVDATLFHYGHKKEGQEDVVGAAPSIKLSSAEQEAERLQPGQDDGGGQTPGTSRREDGVRIIEGSMLGQRGLDDLQTDLARWELINNVSICVCKRRDETDLQGLVQFEDFVLGFTTSDQLEAWAQHGSRAICLDNAQIRVSGGMSSLLEGQMSVCSVQVVTATSLVLPVAWLLTSRYSDALLKYFLMCLRVAYESFHNGPVTEPQFVMGETDSRFHKIWHEVFGGSSPPVLAARNTHKAWMAQLNSVIDPSKRQQVWEEMFAVVRDSPDDSPAALHDLLQRLAQDSETEPFASYMTEQWMPQQRLEDSVLPPVVPTVARTSKTAKYKDKTYNRGLYLDVLHTLYTFLYVDQAFSIDCDECVYKVQLFTANALLEAATIQKNSSSNKVQRRSSINGLHSNDQSFGLPSSPSLPHLRTEGSSRLVHLTEARHRAACALGPDSVTSMGPHSWRVRSPNSSGETHVVKREALNRSASQGSLRSICSSACTQVCRLCEVCVHQYTCTCPDSVILSVVCVHVHLIRVLMRNPQHVPMLASASSTRGAAINSHSSAHHSEEKLKTAIKRKCYSIISMLKTDNGIYANAKEDYHANKWNTDYLLQCDQQLESMINSLNNTRTSLANTDSVNTCTTFTDNEDKSCFTTSNLREEQTCPEGQHAYYIREKTALHTADTHSLSSDPNDPVSMDHDSVIKSSPTDSVPLTTYECSDNSSSLVSGMTAGNNDLLVLQEENGRYRLVTGEHEILRGRAQAKSSILYGPMTPADPSTLLVHRAVDRTASGAPLNVTSELR